ncbi:general stress protein [Georgenia sp. Z1344]|uniref:general stress protein n=1 Tax=Georgenia sp. Z1344 TaxID=3416706 RepID=UPI003CE7D764
MTDTTPTTNPATEGPVLDRVVIGHYDSYVGAERAVDLLADKDVDVATVSIVGHDLKSVELVTGNMRFGKAALYGLGGGAWLGLLVGLLLGIFLPSPVWAEVVLGSVVFAAVWGLIFGLAGYGLVGRRRSFRSTSGTRASVYTVEVPADIARQATQVLDAGR